jgi:hypothetical protein
MSATTLDQALSATVGAGSAQRGAGVFSRLLAALHHSRELRAGREIARYRHLIASARAYRDTHPDALR